ncbi:hypothetical protein COT87_00905 [Candidatus Collierbacteria bacterium CG10_big_fil_rev_8_21_14_0_10_44_9]|uniref:Glutamine--fructose-6-phosphate aminotransferase [isomerizing] n=1 Tax=Candidatus Collierbacteria bacterium CG10_big_fil_rev_8_21_14_0_10_44_9 TaxID=1974535 RepID=A0A2H0VJ81_9BACT|nr:MAG: hypothetical protein COT87_00905 [Candidatus Collierbacteria bacterium CG10_big_fil_rev_8_21_14_0_10_44_9]
MCGIFAYRGSRNAAEVVFNGLLGLQYRGYDSWGIAMIGSSGLKVKKDIGALPSRISGLTMSSQAIGHTRWATHGGVTKSNSHPHVSCDKRFVVVHNGIIENFNELKSKLSGIHNFTSATDTELIVHYLEENEKIYGISGALQKLIINITGHSAFVVLDCLTKQMYAYRSGSPLVLGKKGNEIFISSDLPTLAPQVDHIYPLHENELIDVVSGAGELDWIASQYIKTEKSKFTTRYHMESEMYETEGILKNIINSPNTKYREIKKYLTPSRNIVLTGCGSSYHACLFGQYLFSQIGINARAIIASEGDSVLPLISSTTTIIVLSQSGETIDSLDFVIKAKAKGAYIISLTNVRHSSLDRLADTPLDLGVGIEVAVASTKAFIFMQLFFVRLVTALSNLDISEDLNSYLKALTILYTPSSKKRAKDLASKLVSRNNLFIVTHGDLIPLGFEAALKFKEIGYLFTENIVSGELKHGSLALINKDSLCLTINRSNSKEMEHTVSEIKAREGVVVAVSLPDLGMLTSLYGANVIHLVSFYHSILLGHNPDRPRNLAKSVTVK